MSLALSASDAASHAWDVIVIGAGPAGAIAATLLARKGVRTLLVNRDPHPRFKVCGGCLAPAGAQALREVCGHNILRHTTLLNRFSLHAAGRALNLPITGFTSISRADLDHALVQEAVNAGASLCIARATVIRKGNVALDDGTQSHTLRTGLIIAADGLVGSSLSHDPRFAWIDAPATHIGLGAVAPASSLPVHPHTITMLCAATGYVGLAPLADGSASIAAALSPASIHHGPANAVAAIAKECGHDPAPFSQLRFRGTPPLTRRRAAVEAPGILVLGDAAGYVEPFTGEGMTWAILSAQACIPFALAALHARATPGAWSAHLHRLLAPRRLRCHLLARGLRHAPLLAASMSLAAHLPSAVSTVAQWLTRPPTGARSAA